MSNNTLAINGGIPFSSFAQGGAAGEGDFIVGLRGSVNTIFTYPAPTTAAPNLTYEVNQPGHGRQHGEIVAIDDTGYILANNLSPDTAAVVGIVTYAIDADNYQLLIYGLFTTLDPIVVGGQYWLDDADGQYTLVRPEAGKVNKLVMLGLEPNLALWVNYVGIT